MDGTWIFGKGSEFAVAVNESLAGSNYMTKTKFDFIRNIQFSTTLFPSILNYIIIMFIPSLLSYRARYALPLPEINKGQYLYGCEVRLKKRIMKGAIE